MRSLFGKDVRAQENPRQVKLMKSVQEHSDLSIEGLQATMMSLLRSPHSHLEPN